MNTSVANAVGEGIMLSKKCRPVDRYFDKKWVKYLFKRMGLVKSKGNTKAKMDIEKFFEAKSCFFRTSKVLSPWMRYWWSW